MGKKIQGKKKRILIFTVGVIMVFAAAAIAWHAAVNKGYEVTTYSMGSYVQQTVYGGGKEEAAQEAANNVALLEDKISWRAENSDIQKINGNAGGSFVEVDGSTYALLQLAQDVSRLSGGAFDVTIAPLSGLWDFDSMKEAVPSASLINELLPYVNYGNLLLDDGTAALKRERMAVDLGAIGKGAACDIAVNTYRDAGVSHAIVAVGGSVGVYGSKPFGEPWKIAVRDPKTAGAMGEMDIFEGFVSTSGSYEKYFEQDGVLYHHLLDPETGYPADSGLLSVTVHSGSGALSDALSTACFVLGYEKSLSLLESYQSDAVFITAENEVYITEGLKDSVRIVSDVYQLVETNG